MHDLDHVREFTVDELRDVLSAAEVPVVVEFWEPRCSACRATLQTIDDLACRIDDNGIVGTFNVRDDPETARSFGVESVPTLLVVRDGEVDSTLAGAETIQRFLERIDEEIFFGRPPTCDS